MFEPGYRAELARHVGNIGEVALSSGTLYASKVATDCLASYCVLESTPALTTESLSG
jgi:hypothetical protein